MFSPAWRRCSSWQPCQRRRRSWRVLLGQRIPQLILLILGGVIIGPEVLGLEVTDEIELIKNVGLGLVFLLAGFEIDPVMLFDRPGRLAVIAWVASVVVAAAVVGGLTATGYVTAFTASASP